MVNAIVINLNLPCQIIVCGPLINNGTIRGKLMITTIFRFILLILHNGFIFLHKIGTGTYLSSFIHP